MKLQPYFISYTKTNSKWINHLTVRAKTTKFLEENMGINLHGLGFLDIIPKTQVTKEKIDKLVFVKIKNFCASNDTIKRDNS